MALYVTNPMDHLKHLTETWEAYKFEFLGLRSGLIRSSEDALSSLKCAEATYAVMQAAIETQLAIVRETPGDEAAIAELGKLLQKTPLNHEKCTNGGIISLLDCTSW